MIHDGTFRVADYRNATERESVTETFMFGFCMRLKGMGWGGPPIKRPKRKENRDVTPAQQMRLDRREPLVCWLRQLYAHGGAAHLWPAGFEVRKACPRCWKRTFAKRSERQVHTVHAGQDTEFFVMQSFPTFTLIQSPQRPLTRCGARSGAIFASYLLLAATSHKSLAGLETFFPGMTDLALTDVQTGACEDFRLQLWRASGVHCFLESLGESLARLTYQFTHSSFGHMLGNAGAQRRCARARGAVALAVWHQPGGPKSSCQSCCDRASMAAQGFSSCLNWVC